MALIWVDVPNVSAGTPQKLWMYYGNPKAPASGNGQRSFDPDYTLVYHFAEGARAPARHHRLRQQRPDARPSRSRARSSARARRWATAR
jgi:hypothetical protein